MVDVLLTMNEAARNSGPCKFFCVMLLFVAAARLKVEKKHE
jgi:hypothetical protein